MNFIKSYIAVLLASCIIAGSLAVPSIYLDFEIRKEYIAKVLCVQKDQPITICGGKCYLNKRLKKAQQEDQQQSNTGSRLTNINFYRPVANLEVEFNEKVPSGLIS